MDLGEYNKLIEEELKDLKKTVEEGDIIDFCRDMPDTDNISAEIHRAYKNGNLTEIGIIVARYFDQCLEKQAKKNVNNRIDFAKELAFIATGVIQD